MKAPRINFSSPISTQACKFQETLLTSEYQQPIYSSTTEELQKQIAVLQEHVAQLSLVTATARPQLRCYTCNRVGHTRRECPTRKIKCFRCGQLGHIARYCHQLTLSTRETHICVFRYSPASCSISLAYLMIEKSFFHHFEA